jgi:8-oxo-dGTP diphosphatase
MKWEFPGGKLEAGETSHAGARREIHEELEIDIHVGKEIGTFITPMGRLRVHLQCFGCAAPVGDPRLHSHAEVRWCRLDELPELDWAHADIPVVNSILSINLPLSRR